MGENAQVEMRRTCSKSGQIEVNLCVYKVPKDREEGSWKTEDQMFEHLKENNWWAVDTRGTNLVIVEEYPKKTPPRSGTSTCPGLATLATSHLCQMSRRPLS
jgi:hypothetical protein